ncbi:MAG: stage 0 sporulation family protein [Phycisphaerales bacterium]
MPILPLPQFEEDLKADAEVYARLKPPTSIVVRFGAMRMVGEFPYDGDAKPGCGSKMVVRTFRGTELGEMLTSTCPNSGCSKSVSRKEMLEYIDNSGGRDYPFHTDGRVLRIATVEDLNRQAALDEAKHEHVKFARSVADRLGLAMKVVDAEEVLGGERMVFFFTTLGDDEHARIDFRPMVMELAAKYRTRVDVRQVGARDDARLTADYEKCGQHCCCKQFLKVLKPVSMKNAKIQKATLDPLKISGRCGRLMCCLRYEESTYDELRAKLPKKKVRLITPDGPGFVVDTQILTQLVLVQLDKNGDQSAYPLENLDLTTPPPPAPPAPPPFGSDRPPSAPGGPPGRGGPDQRGPRPPRSGPRDGPRDGPRQDRRPPAR